MFLPLTLAFILGMGVVWGGIKLLSTETESDRAPSATPAPSVQDDALSGAAPESEEEARPTTSSTEEKTGSAETDRTTPASDVGAVSEEAAKTPGDGGITAEPEAGKRHRLSDRRSTCKHRGGWLEETSQEKGSNQAIGKKGPHTES